MEVLTNLLLVAGYLVVCAVVGGPAVVVLVFLCCQLGAYGVLLGRYKFERQKQQWMSTAYTVQQQQQHQNPQRKNGRSEHGGA